MANVDLSQPLNNSRLIQPFSLRPYAARFNYVHVLNALNDIDNKVVVHTILGL